MKTILIIITVIASLNVWSQWTKQHPFFDSDDLNDIQFIDDQTGWAAGRGGLLLYTENGGNTWIRQSTGTTTDLMSVSFIDHNEGWITGRDEILCTLDGGASWQSNIKCTSYGLNSICFTDPDNGWAAGVSRGGGYWGSSWSYDRIMHTIDGGVPGSLLMG